MKKVSWLVAALFFHSGAWAIDLMQAYRLAENSDPTFAAAIANADVGREKEIQGRALLLPSMTVSGTTYWNDATQLSRAAGARELNSKYNSNTRLISLNQPVFRWQNFAQYGMGKAQAAQAEAQLAKDRQDLILRVSQAYFDALSAQENLRFLQAQKLAISQQLEQAKKNFEVGTATITDTHEAQARYDLAVAQEIAADSDREYKLRGLQALIGRDPGELSPLRKSVQLDSPEPSSMDKWVEAAEKDNIDVQVRQAAADAASKAVDVALGGHLPTLDLVAKRLSTSQSAGISAIGSFPGYDNTTDVIGLELSIPVFQGGATSSREREARAGHSAALANLEGARRQAALNARQAYLGVVSGLSAVKAYEAALASSRLAVDSNKLGYDVGVRINIDVLNAEQQVYSTQRDLTKARFDTLIAQLRLKAAVGALGEEEVQKVNALLDLGAAR